MRRETISNPVPPRLPALPHCLLTCALLGGAAHGQPPTAPALETSLEEDLLQLLPEIPMWQRYYTARVGAGYKDNVLLSDSHPQESAFAATGLEFFASRLPDEQGQIDFFASVEDYRYLDSVDVESEQLIYTQVNFKKDLDERTHLELPASYIYQHQVMDVSTASELDILKVRGHTMMFEPSLRLDLAASWWCKGQANATRQWFESPLDDYWEVGPGMEVGRSYGAQSEMAVHYRFGHRSYDSDESLDQDGLPIPGTARTFNRHEVEWRWRHFWDARNRWRSTTRLGYQRNEDSAEGYFDYNRYLLGHQLRFRTGTWTLLAEFKLYFYDYGHQTVSLTDADKRSRDELSLRVRAEKKVGKYLAFYAEAEREQVNSNIDSEEYRANVVSGGLLWEF